MNLESKLITGPSEEPVTLDEVKTHLKLAQSFTDEDSYLTRMISTARSEGERISRRAFLTQTWEQYQDSFPLGDTYNHSIDRRCIHLVRPRLQSVTFVQFLDPDGAQQTMNPSNYVVDTGSEPGRISTAIGVPWPPTARLPKAVTVRLVCGWADTVEEALAAEPKFNTVQTVILMMIGHWYSNREPVVSGQVASLPNHLNSMLLGLRP